MKRLVNCLDKLVGKLITKADADLLVSEARAYEQEGYSPAEAEKMAVADAIEDTESTGQSVLDQIQQGPSGFARRPGILGERGHPQGLERLLRKRRGLPPGSR